jgi:hypothetical protein
MLTKETRDQLRRNHIPKIAGPIIPQGNRLYETLMRFVFRGTDIEDLANYPKRSGRNTI